MWHRVHWPGLDFTRILKDTHFEIAGAEEIKKKKKKPPTLQYVKICVGAHESPTLE